jgi:hypothetical protein
MSGADGAQAAATPTAPKINNEGQNRGMDRRLQDMAISRNPTADVDPGPCRSDADPMPIRA